MKTRTEHTVYSQRGTEGAKQRGFGASGEANVKIDLQSENKVSCMIAKHLDMRGDLD